MQSNYADSNYDLTRPLTPVILPNEEPKQERANHEFDAYAAQYEASLHAGLSITGEGPEYFARHRIAWTADVLGERSFENVLDFGCGVGIATPLLHEHFTPNHLWGFDPSTAAIERAHRDFPADTNQFFADPDRLPDSRMDFAYCNGVFHHIAPKDRAFAFRVIFRCLKPGGWFAFWENNPWNPGTRYVMSRIPFDRDAIVISPREGVLLLQTNGFKVSRRDSLFLFPRSLRWLRPVEKLLHSFPIGAQYLVLGQKPRD